MTRRIVVEAFLHTSGKSHFKLYDIYEFFIYFFIYVDGGSRSLTTYACIYVWCSSKCALYSDKLIFINIIVFRIISVFQKNINPSFGVFRSFGVIFNWLVDLILSLIFFWLQTIVFRKIVNIFWIQYLFGSLYTTVYPATILLLESPRYFLWSTFWCKLLHNFHHLW